MYTLKTSHDSCTQKELILSVAMSNYNHSKYLPERIPSLLAAMPENSEFIIVDDGSTDESVDIIEKFASQDKRIVFLRNFQNQGLNASYRRIIESAQGKYMAFLGADDVILPNFFSDLLLLAHHCPSAPIICSDNAYTLPDTKEEIKVSKLIPDVDYPCFFPKEKIVEIFFKFGFGIPGHTCIIKREPLLQRGEFDLRLEHIADWFLFHSIAMAEGVAYLPKALSIWRIYETNYSSIINDNTKVLLDVHKTVFKILGEKNNKVLRKKWRNSALLRGIIKQKLINYYFFPKYWDYILVCFFWKKFQKYRRQLFKCTNSALLQKFKVF